MTAAPDPNASASARIAPTIARCFGFNTKKAIDRLSTRRERSNGLRDVGVEFRIDNLKLLCVTVDPHSITYTACALMSFP